VPRTGTGSDGEGGKKGKKKKGGEQRHAHISKSIDNNLFAHGAKGGWAVRGRKKLPQLIDEVSSSQKGLGERGGERKEGRT